ALGLLGSAEVFQIRQLRRAKDLDPLDREVTVKARQGEAGPVDRGFANAPVETDLRTLELHLQSLRVAGVKLAHRYGWMFGFGSGHWRGDCRRRAAGCKACCARKLRLAGGSFFVSPRAAGSRFSVLTFFPPPPSRSRRRAG